ncbi:MAG: hypothetical protein ACREX3_04925 [Gammaproteobacteria bacterium]
MECRVATLAGPARIPLDGDIIRWATDGVSGWGEEWNGSSWERAEWVMVSRVVSDSPYATDEELRAAGVPEGDWSEITRRGLEVLTAEAVSPPGWSRREFGPPVPPKELDEDEYSMQLSINALKAFNARKGLLHELSQIMPSGREPLPAMIPRPPSPPTPRPVFTPLLQRFWRRARAFHTGR